MNSTSRDALRLIDGRWILDIERAKELINAYNESTYRGYGTNREIDSAGYRLFRDGMATERRGLEEQIHWIGEVYGGVVGRFRWTWRDESRRIVENFPGDLSEYGSVPRSAQSVPPPESLSTLLHPFRATQDWFVCATKFFFFACPDGFPIVDSRV
ncbi:MAG: hypothetical protein KC466_16600 [Myxococcales bacterium]|nr:hypothetical protein [Myxococcales bacterium]